MISYVQIENCVDIIPNLADPSPESAKVEAALMESLLDASRMFESETLVGVDYYQQAPVLPFDKEFVGRGTSSIILQPMVEFVNVKNSDGEIVESDAYFIDLNRAVPRFRWLYGACDNKPFNVYQKIKINARWGFLCVPPSASTAVKAMGCLMFLTNHQNRLGIDLALEDEQATRLKNTYNRITAEFRARNYNSLNTGIS